MGFQFSFRCAPRIFAKRSVEGNFRPRLKSADSLPPPADSLRYRAFWPDSGTKRRVRDASRPCSPSCSCLWRFHVSGRTDHHPEAPRRTILDTHDYPEGDLLPIATNAQWQISPQSGN